MIPLRVVWGYLLWRLGARDVLPRHFLSIVPIVECGEPLLPLAAASRIHLRPVVPEEIRLRRSVCEHLVCAADFLPDGFSLVVFEGFRSLQRQEELWKRELAAVRAAQPLVSPDELRRRTRLRIAEPGAQGANHQTGGAVDLTLGDAAGHPLDMGTRYDEFTPWTPMKAPGLPLEVRRRRRILRKCLWRAGFAFYPGEWWHFCFGDRMWAAYRRRRVAVYGPCDSASAELAGHSPEGHARPEVEDNDAPVQGVRR